GHEEIDHSPDFTLAQCLVSANVLGDEFREAAARFLTWRIPQMSTHFEWLIFPLGLLILATLMRAGRFDEMELGTIAEWVLERESLQRQRFPGNPDDPMPLLFSIQYGTWPPLVAQFLNEVRGIGEKEVRTNLELCALLLDPGLSH